MKTAHLLVAASVALIATASAQVPVNFEQGVVLNSADLLPAASLRGPSYRVRDMVVTDGFMAHFPVDSDFGTFEAVGVPQAQRRMVEVEAIKTLVETSKSDLFAEGLRRSVAQPIEAVRNIVTHPVDSMRQAPRTVGHFFGGIGSAITRGVDKAQDRANGDRPAPTAGEVGQGIGNAAKNVTGFDKAKLDTARQLGVDPYSDNARLQEEMEKVTWAFFAGGLPLRVVTGAASAGVAVAATNMVGIPEETYALTQAELARRDADSLTAMGVTGEDIASFELNPVLSTTRRHRIALALAALPTARGRGLIVRLANSCETSDQADFLAAALNILAERQLAGTAEFVSLEVLGRLPGATNSSGTLEVPAPVDHVTWTEQVAGFANRADLAGTRKTLVHTGSLSPVAAAGFAAAGWSTIAVPYSSR